MSTPSTIYKAASMPVKAIKGVDTLKVRNDLLLSNPNYFHAIMKVDDPYSPMSAFGNSLGGLFGTTSNEDQFSVEKSAVGSEYVQYLYYSENASMYPSKVTSNTGVPDTIVAGENIELELDEQIYEPGAKLLLRNKTDELYCVGKRHSFGNTTYTFQLVGREGYTISKELLSVGSPLTYSGNIYPEGSKTNHPVLLGGPKRIERAINLLSIIRHEYAATGSAESNDHYYVFQSQTQGKLTELGFSNWPVKFVKSHLQTLNHQLIYSRANFDPATKKVNNRNSQGQFHEVPSFSGIREQLSCAKHQWTYDLKATSYSNAIKFLEGILKYMSSALGKTDMNLIAYATGAGRAWLRKVIREGGLKVSGVSLQQIITGGETTVFGYKSDKYVCDYGTITIYDVAESRCYDRGAFDKITYDGVQYDRESLDIFFFPDKIEGKPTIRIYYKNGEYNGKNVNRMMVFGHQKGMSGYSGNTLNFTDAQVSDAAVESALRDSKYDVSSAFDGDLWMGLSHISVMVDTSRVAKLTLSTPSNRTMI